MIRIRSVGDVELMLLAPAVFPALLALSSLPATAQVAEVSVRLFHTHPGMRAVVVQGPLQIIYPAAANFPGRSLTIRLRNGRLQALPDSATARLLPDTTRIVLRGQDGITAISPEKNLLRRYKGTISLAAGAGELAITNRLAMRDYIKSVVGSETNPEFSSEALKSMSVLAQTLMARYQTGDRLNDSTEKQAYLGLDAVRPQVSEAVDQTFGESLSFAGSPAVVYYHSTCAGGTSDGEKYFGLKDGEFPYLHGRTCTYCRQSPFWTTKTAVVPAAKWQEQFGKQTVSVQTVDAQKRPLKVNVGGRITSGYEFWMELGQKLGWDKVPGTRFAISQQSNHITVTSTGAGHGVGLCQWGADGLARLGKSYLEILAYYFPGTTVKRIIPLHQKPASQHD